MHAGDFLHLPDEMRIDVPIRTVVPGDVLRAHRMADEEEFHFAAAVDEDCLRIGVEKGEGFAPASGFSWRKVITGRSGALFRDVRRI